jgi:hypothetical protein
MGVSMGMASPRAAAVPAVMSQQTVADTPTDQMAGLKRPLRTSIKGSLLTSAGAPRGAGKTMLGGNSYV